MTLGLDLCQRGLGLGLGHTDLALALGNLGMNLGQRRLEGLRSPDV